MLPASAFYSDGMKYKPQDYATAFIEVAMNAPKTREEQIIKNFLKIVQKNGDLGKIGKIAELAEKILLQKTGRNRWVVEIARVQGNLRKILENIIGADDILEQKINPELIAGIKITKNDERQFDGSLKRKINKMIYKMIY
jgi:F0F1-type ATP synthase delta subunit